MVKKVLGGAVIGLVAVVIVLVSAMSGLVQTWELKTYDARMAIAVRSSTMLKTNGGPQDVVLFYVDEPSLQYFKNMNVSWPWPRELYPMALDFCRRGGARAVVFDLFYSEPSVYGVQDDETFASGVKQGPPSYFVLFASGNEADEDPRLSEVLAKGSVKIEGDIPYFVRDVKSFESLPIPQLIGAAAGFGDAEADPDVDGIYRRITLLELYGDRLIPAVSLKVAADDLRSKVSGLKSDLYFGDWKVPLDSDGKMLIRYYGPADTFPNYPLAEVMQSSLELQEGKPPSLDPSVVKDKIVVIGVAAPGLYDLKPMPLSRVYPGPEIHATVIQNLLSREAMVPTTPLVQIIIIVAIAFIAAAGLAVIKSSWGMGLLIGGMGVAYTGGAVALFTQNVWVPVVQPLMALALSSFGMVAKNYLTEGRKKRQIRRAFGQYLSPHVVAEISKDPDRVKLGGQEQMLTLFFSDIADFTSISERMTPTKLVTDLNEYLTHVTRIILENDGTLDKYIGDAVMAFWGAPLSIADHEAKAILASLEIQNKLTDFPRFVTRIGIHTGPVVVGNIGSEQRFNYTAIGDTVNLASRLEGLNKKFGTRILISETAYNRAQEIVYAREVGRVRVKGRAEPIGVYEPLGKKGEVAREKIASCEMFADGLVTFRNGNFTEACAKFEKMKDDPAAAYYRKLCVEHLASPPRDFDGVVSFETK